MGTRIEPTISNHPGDAPGVIPGTAAPHGDADTGADPTLAELAALESEVDNWLHAPAKAGPAAPEPEPARAEPGGEPANLQPPPPAQPATAQPAPRRKRQVGWWVFGAAALAAIAGAAVLLDEPAAPVRTVEQAPARAAPAAPAPAAVVPAPAPAEPRPELVFLEQPPAKAAKATEPPAKPAAAEPASAKPQRPTIADKPVAARAAPARPKNTDTVKKAKPASKPVPPPETREPSRRTQTWPPDRRASDAQRVEAARAECRARSRDPAACHIRVCDVLGSSHPACRE